MASLSTPPVCGLYCGRWGSVDGESVAWQELSDVIAEEGKRRDAGVWRLVITNIVG